MDIETWNKLQAEMDRKANRKGIAGAATALLTNVAVCAKCAGPMYRIQSNKKRKDGSRRIHLYYRCHGLNDRQPSRCGNMVPLWELDQWITLDQAAKRQLLISLGITIHAERGNVWMTSTEPRIAEALQGPFEQVS